MDVSKCPRFEYHGNRMMQPADEEALRELCEQLPFGSKVLEIGSHIGTSACIIAKALKQKLGQVFCVDHWEEGRPSDPVFDHFVGNVYALGLQKMVHPIHMRWEYLRGVLVEHSFDLVFIDCDHRYAYVMQDIATCLPFVTQEGIIGGHDYDMTTQEADKYIPMSAWDSVVDFKTGEHELHRVGNTLIHFGVIRAVDETFGKNVNHKGAIWWVKP